MSVQSISGLFQLVFLVGCGNVFHPSECLELNAINGQSFSPNASAEFECIIDPYTNSQTWYFDSVYVADCGITVCMENTSNPDRYTFITNTSAGHFIFKINQILLEDDKKVIRCSDGNTFKETDISVSVSANEGGGSGGGGGSSWWIPLIIVIIIVVIVSVLCVAWLVIKETDDFYVSETEGTSATVCWKKCDGKQRDKTYILRCSTVEPQIEIPDEVNSTETVKTVMEYTLSNLKTSTNYELNLKCVDKSAPEKLLKQYKPLELRAAKATDFETAEFYVLNTKGTSVTVGWNKYNGIHREIKYSLRCSRVEQTEIPVDDNSNTVMEHTLSPLKTSTNYELNLKCVDKSASKKLFKQYKPLKLKTEETDHFYVSETEGTSATVCWKKCDGKQRAKKYILRCLTVESQRYIEIPDEVNSTETVETVMENTLSHLKKSTNYELNLKCVDKSAPEKLLRQYKPLDPRGENATNFETDEFYVLKTQGTSVTVCWKKYNGEHREIKYSLTCLRVEQTEIAGDDNSNTVMKHTLSPLKTSTNYELNLKCVDKSASKKLFKQYKPLKLKTEGPPDNVTGFITGHKDTMAIGVEHTIISLHEDTEIKMQGLSVNEKGATESDIEGQNSSS